MCIYSKHHMEETLTGLWVSSHPCHGMLAYLHRPHGPHATHWSTGRARPHANGARTPSNPCQGIQGIHGI